MKVFISWSGDRSKIVATSLSKWLSDVFQDIVTWVSSHNIDAGQRWGHELTQQLATTSFGILCLTPENIGAPWLLFEAGALSKVIGEAKVVPYLFELSTTDVPFPLAQFQGVEASNGGTLQLVKSINSSLEHPISSDRIERLFAKWWNDLKRDLDAVPAMTTGAAPAHRSERALLEEILQTVRNLSRTKTSVPAASAPALVANKSHDVDIWRGVSVWNVSEADMAALSLEDLTEFRAQASAASSAAVPDAKEAAIDRKVEQADAEIKRRQAKIV